MTFSTCSIPRQSNGNFYSISCDANLPIKRPDFNDVYIKCTIVCGIIQMQY